MNSQNHTSEKKTVLITDSIKNIEEILCKSLFNDLLIHLTKEKNAIIDICKAHDTIVLSTNRLDICTLVYKHYLDGKCNLHLLQPIDIDETGLDDETIFRFTLFNLELFGQRSLRAKATYIANKSIADIRKDKYEKIFHSELMDNAPFLYINLYRVIAFENQAALLKIFELLKELDDTKIAACLDSFLVLILNSNSINKFSETLINYYEDVDCIESPHKYLIFQFLNKIYRKINKSELLKIKNWLYPITSYCLSEDTEGKYIELLKMYNESLPKVSKNINCTRIVTYSRIFNAGKYFSAFCSSSIKPSNKLEENFNNTLLKVENLVDIQKLGGIPKLELKRGVDQYIKFLNDNKKPDKCSAMFELLFR